MDTSVHGPPVLPAALRTVQRVQQCCGLHFTGEVLPSTAFTEERLLVADWSLNSKGRPAGGRTSDDAASPLRSPPEEVGSEAQGRGGVR